MSLPEFVQHVPYRVPVQDLPLGGGLAGGDSSGDPSLQMDQPLVAGVQAPGRHQNAAQVLERGACRQLDFITDQPRVDALETSILTIL